MLKRIALIALLGVVLAGLAGVGWRVLDRGAGASSSPDGVVAVPVEVAAVDRGVIELRRTFSGSLESPSAFRVASKVAGRVDRLAVDLADEVVNGSVVVELDGEEFEQAVAVAQAELAVSEANLTEARSTLEIAERTIQRQTTLRERGVSSDAQLDEALAEQLASAARVAVAQANVTRAQSALQTAKIRLGYTQVTAAWTRGDGRRVVGERYVEEGDTVAANVPLLMVVELDPLRAVLFVSERDYVKLSPGQAVVLRVDAYTGESFPATVERVSAVFESSSRQARVELVVPNAERKLKPGMFVRAEAVLERVEDAVVVPVTAVVKRHDRSYVFRVDDASMTASLVAVELGVQEGDRVQVRGETADALTGRVVTLGQHQLDDGSLVKVREDEATTSAALPGPGPGAMRR